MEWMLMPLKRYADFSGRSRRKEYWMFILGYVIALGVLTAIGGVLGAFSGGADGPDVVGLFFIGLIVIFVLGLFIPSLAVQVRRFHDQDKSGWFVLLGLVPYVGGLIVLVFMCLEGTNGPNRFGDDPKGVGNADVFE